MWHYFAGDDLDVLFLETAARKEDCPTVTTNPKVFKLVMLCIQALRYLEP